MTIYPKDTSDNLPYKHFWHVTLQAPLTIYPIDTLDSYPIDTSGNLPYRHLWQFTL